jgi:hypothetical protein
MIIITSDALLQLAHLQQVLSTDTPTELRDQGDMLADVARQLTELRILLHETLHVGDGLDVVGALGARLVLLDVILDVAAQVAKVEVHIFLEKGVLVL